MEDDTQGRQASNPEKPRQVLISGWQSTMNWVLEFKQSGYRVEASATWGEKRANNVQVKLSSGGIVFVTNPNNLQPWARVANGPDERDCRIVFKLDTKINKCNLFESWE